MKIGDLDELKEVFRWTEQCMLSKKEILDIIDDAKPVEIDETVIQDMLHKRCMTVCTNEFLVSLLNENDGLKNQIDDLLETIAISKDEINDLNKTIGILKQIIIEYELKEGKIQ